MPFKDETKNREYMREYMRKRRQTTVQVNASVALHLNLNSNITELSISLIDPSPHLIREIDGVALSDLKMSIQKVGVLQPILVRPKNDRYEIVDGNHRFKVAKLIPLSTIPAQIRQMDDKEALLFGAIENIQRLEMNPLEEGKLFSELLEFYPMPVLCEKLGKCSDYVKARMKLQGLADELKPELGRRLTITQALTLSSYPKFQQLNIFEKIEAAKRGQFPVSGENPFIERSEAKEGEDVVICSDCGTRLNPSYVTTVDGKPFCLRCAPFTSVKIHGLGTENQRTSNEITSNNRIGELGTQNQMSDSALCVETQKNTEVEEPSQDKPRLFCPKCKSDLKPLKIKGAPFESMRRFTCTNQSCSVMDVRIDFLRLATA